jgi:hypothetical protein
MEDAIEFIPPNPDPSNEPPADQPALRRRTLDMSREDVTQQSKPDPIGPPELVDQQDQSQSDESAGPTRQRTRRGLGRLSCLWCFKSPDPSNEAARPANEKRLADYWRKARGVFSRSSILSKSLPCPSRQDEAKTNDSKGPNPMPTTSSQS